MDILMFLEGLAGVLFSIILLAIIYSPLILPTIAILMVVCGKGHVLKSWFKKFKGDGRRVYHHKSANFLENSNNPATGLPRISSGSSFDVGGNVYGTNSASNYNHH